MANTILLKRSDISNSVPSTGNLVPGELALNYTDGNLFFKDSSDNIVLLSSTKVVSVTGNITGNNIIANTSGQLGNITISGSNINSSSGRITVNSASQDVDFSVNGISQANVFYVDAAAGTVSVGNSTQIPGAILSLNSSSSMRLPVGNIVQRPDAAQAGMIRFNTENDTVEFYTVQNGWQTSGQDFTIIESETFFGDGYSKIFTLSEPRTTNSCIISINGIVQIPGTAYSISGTTLTFTGAPGAGYNIEVRALTTTSTSTVTAISNNAGNAVISVNETTPTVSVTGNLIPTGNSTQTLGNVTNLWESLYLSGNTIYLGDLQLKAVSATEFGIFQHDGTSMAALVTGELDTTGNINVGNIHSDGYYYANGEPFVSSNYSNANVEAYLPTYTGNLTSLTGNITTTANISGNYIFGNGSQLTGLPEQYSNANVAAYLPTYTGNLVSLAGPVTTTANITGAYFIGNGALLSGIDATSIQNGSSNVSIAASNGNVTINVGGVSNAAVFASSGANIAGTLEVSGNITGGNVSGTNVTGTILTSAQPNITSVGTLSSLTVSGNLSAGNLQVVGLETTSGIVVSGNATITGNLTVQGNQFIANVSTLQVSDPLIGLGRGPNNTPLTSNDGLDRGLELWYYTDQERMAFVGYDNANAQLTLACCATESNNIVTVSNWGTTKLGNIISTGNVTGGNIVTTGQVVATGNVSGATGVFTNVTGNGAGLSSITGANVTGIVPTANVATNIFALPIGGTVSVLLGGTSGNTQVGTTSNVFVNTTLNGGTLYAGGLLSLNIGNNLSTINANNITAAGNVTASGRIIVTGNINSGNLITTTILATGSIQGGNLLTLGNVTAVGTITGGNLSTGGNATVFGNITGGNVSTAGVISATGNITGGNITTGGVIRTTGNITGGNITTGGTITGDAITGGNLLGLGNATVFGNITGGNIITTGIVSLSSITKTGFNGVGNIGSSTNTFNAVFARATSALYADLAEMYKSDIEYAPGTVVIFGGDQEITQSTQSHDTRVAGVISTNPAFLMNSSINNHLELPVALTGRVPCRVQGPVSKGDVLASGSLPGTAQKLSNWQPGCVIGKSLEDIVDESVQTIEVVVGRF